MKRILSLIILLVLMPGTARALGLGNLELDSALNEPFNGRITLLSATADELDSLRVGLADTDAFARAGLDRPFVLSKLKFSLKRAIDEGPDFIIVTSQTPIREPFLNFLVEVSWSKGRLFREYTVLLDPPLYDPNARAVDLRPTETISEMPAPAPAVIDEDHNVVYADDFERYQSGAAQQPTISYGGGDYGPTNADDTLWSIASAMRPDSSVSVNQMMLALLSANPDAFLDGNINGLKRGQILRMPSADTINSMSQAQALEEVKAQYAAWDQMAGVASAAVAERPETVSAPTDMEPEDSTAAAADDDAELKLVAASDEADATEQAISVDAGAGEDLVLAQESIQALTQENLELKDQLKESEALLNDLKRLLELKDDELATLQQQLAAQPEEVIAEQEMDVVDEEEMMEEAEEEVVEEVIEEPVIEEVEEEVAIEEEAEVVTEPEPVVEEAIEAVEEEVAVVEEVETIEVIEAEPAPADDGIMGMLNTYLGPIKDIVMGNILYAAGALGLLIVLILLSVVMKFRKKSAETSSAEAETVEAFPDFSASESDLDEAQEELGSEAETALPESEDETFIPGEEEPAAEEEEVEKTVLAAEAVAEPEPEPEEEEEEEDPLQEVNTYLAFEQFDQAEEFVRNAIKDKPDNPEFHTKLLEVFYTSGNKKAYEEEAKELNDLVNGEGEHWDMALAMWSEMSPNRALFEAGAEDEEDTSDTTGGGFVNVTADEEAADEGLDFDIGAGDTGAEETQAEAAEGEEELLDITAADEGEDILDVTAAVGLEEEQAPEAESEEEDILDISGSSAGEDLLDVTAAAGAEEQAGAEEEMLDISSGGSVGEDLLDLTAGDEAPAGEDLLDVTAATNLEPDTDEDLLDVTAATSAGADSDELLDLDIESSEKAEEAESSDNDNVIDFDLATSGDTEEESLDLEAENLEEGLELDIDAGTAETEDAGLELDLGEAAEESAEEEEPIRLDMDIEEEGADAIDETQDISIDLDMGEAEEPAAAEESADMGMELSLDESEAEPEIELDGTVEIPKAGDTAAEEEPAGMDFDLSLDESEAEPEIELDGTVEIPKVDTEADEDDDDDDDEDHTVFVPRAAQPEEQSVEDEIATKLDLAKAYVELGDKDSAKTILDEVLAEGNDEQKKQAQDLMGQI